MQKKKINSKKEEAAANFKFADGRNHTSAVRHVGQV
jgi:hypothetical protein